MENKKIIYKDMQIFVVNAMYSSVNPFRVECYRVNPFERLWFKWFKTFELATNFVELYQDEIKQVTQ